MPIFAVTYRYSPDIATRDALRTEHRDYLRDLADQGLLLVSRPFGPTEPAGALLLSRTDELSTNSGLSAPRYRREHSWHSGGCVRWCGDVRRSG